MVEPTGPVAGHLVQLFTNGDLVQLGADERREGGLLAAIVGRLLILCTYPVHALTGS